MTNRCVVQALFITQNRCVVQRMFIMDAKGWRRVSSLAEMPVTTVSVPGQGLPKLTGLKHELVDPGYYDRHRQGRSG